jgi:hypothetical protein
VNPGAATNMRRIFVAQKERIHEFFSVTAILCHRISSPTYYYACIRYSIQVCFLLVTIAPSFFSVPSRRKPSQFWANDTFARANRDIFSLLISSLARHLDSHRCRNAGTFRN